jgi:diaminohydroxyphosphoribosylaminopyrimidine deaminase/5-amino-6-(5-phosphoribosylamino)uracil reductase
MVADPSWDAIFMDRALFLAERGRGRTSPNPMVGAVVVAADGIVIGQGAHLAAGSPHAEVHALDAAGGRAKGATLYCTLEPCCHVGRTGPCTERIVSAGIARVVAAVEDPNPRVAGRGFNYLRAHGVQVDHGEGARAAAAQNAAFFTWITKRRPLVVVKTVMSADGFVGRADRRVQLSGAAADRWFQRQRAEVDAIAVGAGTVLVDDPLLTARAVYRYRPLTRVIFDRRGRVPPTARVFSTLDAGPVIMVVSSRLLADRQAHLDALAQRGAEILPGDDEDPTRTLAVLAERGVTSLLVEGGPTLQTALARARLVDRVQRVTTPSVLGEGVPVAAIARDAPELPVYMRQLGDDTLIEFDVHGTR